MPMKMTPEQSSICNSEEQRVIVEANAGSGKTTTAALKILRLIEGGLDPRKILALSYSEPGVIAYAEAFKRVGIPAHLARLVTVRTFDQFCSERLVALEAMKPQVFTEPESVRGHVLHAISRAREWAWDRHEEPLAIDGTGELAVEGLLKEFELIKGQMLLLRQSEDFRASPKGLAEIGLTFTTAAIYLSYEKLRCYCVGSDGEYTKFRYLGDATYDLAHVVSRDDPIYSSDTNPLSLGIQAVVLDEMHDTNWAMFTVVRALLEANKDALFLGLGDRDQVVHAGIGADPEFMGAGFGTYIGPYSTLPLTETYRFGLQIAQPLGLYSSKPYAAAQGLASQVQVKQTSSADDLLGVIYDAMRDDTLTRYSQLAVLLKQPSAAVELEHLLRNNATKYATKGFTTYLERPEVLFLRVLLGYAVGLPEKFSAQVARLAKRATWAFLSVHATQDTNSLEEINATVEAAHAERFFEYMLPDALALNEVNVLRYHIDTSIQTQIKKGLEIAAGDRGEALNEVVQLLGIAKAARRVFVVEQEALNAEASVLGFVNAAQKYASISEFLASLMAHDYGSRSGSHADERIVLSTIEEAKGLEFEHVIIPDVNARTFDGPSRDVQNLFYVAASRARLRLSITCQKGRPSSYLRHFQS